MINETNFNTMSQTAQDFYYEELAANGSKFTHDKTAEEIETVADFLRYDTNSKTVEDFCATQSSVYQDEDGDWFTFYGDEIDPFYYTMMIAESLKGSVPSDTLRAAGWIK